MNKETLEKIKTLYLSGKSSRQIAKEINCCKSTILKHIKNIPKHKQTRKYTINENYFDTIDTEEKAYFLGLLYSDGCNDSDNARIILGLQDEDREILDKFNIAINSNRPLSFIDCSKRIDKKCKNMYRLTINSRHMSDKLTELGCMKQKTFLLKFPTEDQVPNPLLKHWLRGLWDGDGSFSLSKNKNRFLMNTSIISTKNIIESINLFILKELNIEGSVYKPKKSTKNTTDLHYTGLIKGLKIIRWLYLDSNIYLKRKYDRYLTIEEQLKIISQQPRSKIKNKFSPII